jgi:hypothetical protein
LFANSALTHLVKRPSWVARNSKVKVKCQVVHILLSITQGSSRADLGQTITDKPDSIHKQTVGRALDLKVAEECVGAEESENLIENIVAVAVRIG